MGFLTSYRQNKKILFCSILAFFVSPFVEARVFSFENESFAPYLSVLGGSPSTQHQPYSWQSTSGFTGDRFDLIYGGEFGFYLRGGSMGMKLGALVQKFDPVQGAIGRNAAGLALFSVDSEGLSYGPHFQLDYQFAKTPQYHWMILVGGGIQFAKINNSYSMTTAGQALVGGQTSLNEAYKTQYNFATLGIGTEFFLTRTTTMSFVLGYHYMLEPQWKYVTTGENFAGPNSDGQEVRLENGALKNINWSHIFLQLSFQFYTKTLR